VRRAGTELKRGNESVPGLKVSVGGTNASVHRPSGTSSTQRTQKAGRLIDMIVAPGLRERGADNERTFARERSRSAPGNKTL
jgi:hypothetical protein